MKKITSVDHLRELALKSENGLECFISLAGGAVRSSKQIWYDRRTKKFEVFHGVDGHIAQYTEKQLDKLTHIIEAIKKNSLWYDEEAYA